MIRYLLSLVVLSLAVGPTAGFGQAEIHVVDVQRVMMESIAGKAARNNMEAEVKKSEGRIAVLKAEVDRMRADLAKQKALLAPEAVEEKEAAILRKERDLQRQVQDQRQELSRKNDSEMKRLVSEIDTAIKEVAEKGGHKLVVEKDPRVVVFANERLDLTDQVVKHLDSKKL